MFKLSPELKAKGEKAEADFQEWLNRSGVAFMYIEQSPFSVPEALRRRLKRPDYLVGIPHTGLLAFDVKAKTIYDGKFIFDHEEILGLDRFSKLFNLSVHFACLDPESSGCLWWVPLYQLAASRWEIKNKRRVVTFEVSKAFEVDTRSISFLGVMMHYSFHTLENA